MLKKTMVVLMGLLVSSCSIDLNNHLKRNVMPATTDNYLVFQYKGNDVWAGAMNLAWTDLRDNVIGEEIQLATGQDKVGIRMLNALNHPVLGKQDLDAASYYIKSGYGQKTVDLINKEVKDKFPDKSFADLDINLADKDIISYAYLFKNVAYLIPFAEQQMQFNQQTVKGFYASNSAMRNNISVLDYQNDDEFIIQLKLTNQQDELFLIKGHQDKAINQLVTLVNQKNNPHNFTKLKAQDKFAAPKLTLDTERNYVALSGKFLLNPGFEKYQIAQMKERIKFAMDEKGAKVENEAYVKVKVTSFNPNAAPPKKFILNKPYWIMLKNKHSAKPYFILGIKNTELMSK